MQKGVKVRNRSGCSLDEWVRTLPAPNSRTLAFKGEAKNAFCAAFVAGDELTLHFDPFGCGDHEGEIREVRLKIASPDSLGGENEYRFCFSGGSVFMSCNLTMVENMDQVIRNPPQARPGAIGIPLAAIPLPRFDLAVWLIGRKRASFRAHVSLKETVS